MATSKASSRRRSTGGHLLVLGLAVACTGGPSEPDLSVASVVVTPGSSTLVALGESVTLSASARTASGGGASAGAFIWSVVDASIASIDPSGVVTALANGSTSVTAMVNGISGAATVIVSQVPAEIERVSGDVQFGEVAVPLDSTLVVRVLDARANPVGDVDLAFTPTGDGSADAATAATAADGLASTVWTLGTESGVQQVAVATDPPTAATAVFTATAVAGLPVAVTLASGDAQTELPDYPLPLPISVLVSDEFGNGVADVLVTFSSNGGILTDTEAASDLEGVAQTTWTLGMALGAYAASATIDSIPGSVEFSAEALAFQLDALSVGNVTESDTITLTGSGFDPDPFRNAVTVGDAIATVVGGTQSSLSIVVPGFGCLPERPADVVIQRDLSQGSWPTVWRPADALELAVGEQRVIDDPDDYCLQFLTDATGGDEYLIGVTATANTNAETSIALLGDDGVTEPVLPSPARTPLFSQDPTGERGTEEALRAWEDEHLPKIFAARAAATGLAPAPPNGGDQVVLKVPDIGSDVCADFETITATVRAVGTNVAVLTDDLNPAAGALGTLDLASLLALIDGPLYSVAASYLGAPSDIDDNGVIFVVLTQAVNRLDVGLGFTTAADFFSTAECASSDRREIIYLAAPDPAGEVGPPLDKQALLTDVPPLLAHDVAHLTIFGRRIAAGSPLVASWLSEGQAQLVREVAGFQLLGDSPGADYGSAVVNRSAATTLWYGSQFEGLSYFFGWDGETSRVAGAPDRCSVFGFSSLSTACGGSYAAGVSWSLLRYMADRFAALDRSAIHSTLLDDDGSTDPRVVLAGILGVSFERLMVDWAAALYVDGRVSPVEAPTLQLGSWDLADIFSALPPERRMEPGEVAFSSFGVARTIMGGSTAYTRLAQPGPHGPIAIRVLSARGEAMSTLLAPRLWVVRLK